MQDSGNARVDKNCTQRAHILIEKINYHECLILGLQLSSSSEEGQWVLMGNSVTWMNYVLFLTRATYINLTPQNILFNLIRFPWAKEHFPSCTGFFFLSNHSFSPTVQSHTPCFPVCGEPDPGRWLTSSPLSISLPISIFIVVVYLLLMAWALALHIPFRYSTFSRILSEACTRPES